MPQISCKNLTIAYERETVLENVSFDIEAGDYISIVGENGTGKSTILKGILGLVGLKSGEIVYEPGFRKNHIGYLSQQNQLQKEFPANVYEVVLSGCLNSKGFRPFYNASEKKMAKKNIERLGISEFANKSFADLSGGQRQRVLLARALCATDKIIFLDEPVTGLDPVAIREFYQLIEKFNKEYKITIVMVTHDIENALLYSNKILHLNKDDYFFGTKEKYVMSNYAKEMVASLNENKNEVD